MAENPTPSRNPSAGGCLLAIFIIGGGVAGVVLGQPSIGLIVGGGAGALAALALFLIDRRR